MIRILVFFMMLCVCVQAQDDLAIGQWRTHLPYQESVYVTQSTDRIFYGSKFAVVAIDKADLAIQFYSKVDALTNVGVGLLKFNPYNEMLLIAYTNGVIDLLNSDGQTSTLNQIKNFNNIFDGKTINSVFMADDSTAYIAANYGVSKLNLRREEFAFTTFTGVDVRDILVHEGLIYATTPEGIYRIAEDHFLPDDFGAWERLDETDGFPEEYGSNAITLFEDALFLDVDAVLYRYDGVTLDSIYGEAEHRIAYISAEGMGLLTGWTRGTQQQGRVTYLGANGEVQRLSSDCTFNPFYAIEDNRKSGMVWFADQARQFRYIQELGNSCQTIEFNKPYSHRIYSLTATEDALWVAGGGLSPTFSPLLRSEGFYSYTFEDRKWTTFNQRVTPELIERGELWDFLNVVIHPTNGTVYAGAFVENLVEWDGEQFMFYDDSNSSLNNPPGDPIRTRVSGLAFDQEENLWVSNHSGERPISVLKKDRTWQNFALKGNCVGSTALMQVLVDQRGYKWFTVSGNNGGIVVYDTGASLEDPSDDRCRRFTTNNSELPNNRVNKLAEDLDGDIWIATAEGVVVFQCFDPFDTECDFHKPISDQDANNSGHLLEREDVRTVAIDGGNRKWFGTLNGLFVQSPDGTEQLARFTSENSPLLDNTILDIAIQPTSGEVYIGTASGLISYKGEATRGGAVNSSNIYAFPNPVRPEYEGIIAIKGLAENADVKITDATGQLIYETEALGGQAIWDGNDYTGRRASSGVYLVFSTSNNTFTPDAAVAKILILN